MLAPLHSMFGFMDTAPAANIQTTGVMDSPLKTPSGTARPNAVQDPFKVNIQSPFEGSLVTDVSSRMNTMIQSESKDYEIAKSGGRHSGWLKNYEGKKTFEIESGIKTLEQRVAEHEQKLSDPAKYDTAKNWYQKTPEQQKGLLNTWKNQIARQKEQINILKGIIKNRGGKP